MVVYKYRTSVFKPLVVDTVRRHYESRDVGMDEVSYENFDYSMRETSLFGSVLKFVNLDLLVKDKKKLPGYVPALISASDGSIDNRFLLVYRAGEKFDEATEKDAKLKSVLKSSTYIEEPSLTKTTFSKVFDFMLEFHKEVYDANRLVNLAIFKSSVEEYVVTEKPDMSKFNQAMVKILATCIDYKERMFDVTGFRSMMSIEKSEAFFVFHKLMYEFLVAPGNRSSANLFKEVERRYVTKGEEHKLILGGLFKALSELELVNSSLNEGRDPNIFPQGWTPFKFKRLQQYAGIPAITILKFRLLLSRLEPEMNTESFLLVFDRALGHLVS
jgi:hypothetical protein